MLYFLGVGVGVVHVPNLWEGVEAENSIYRHGIWRILPLPAPLQLVSKHMNYELIIMYPCSGTWNERQ